MAATAQSAIAVIGIDIGKNSFHVVGLDGRGGHGVNPAFLQNPAPQMPAFESRIPAPLASPSQAPVINGPMSQPAFRGMTGIGQ